MDMCKTIIGIFFCLGVDLAGAHEAASELYCRNALLVKDTAAFLPAVVDEHAEFHADLLIHPESKTKTEIPKIESALVTGKSGYSWVYEEILGAKMNRVLDREIRRVGRFAPEFLTGTHIPSLVMGVHSFGQI